jgi:SAM-dependent methyltransferase
MKLTQVADYYSKKLKEHGQTPKGADWNSEESQILRFKQLTKIINQDYQSINHNVFSINDLGCGYGALFKYVKNTYNNFSYTGIDISHDMITAAKNLFVNNKNARFIISSQPDKIADYGIASGIFNVRLDCSDTLWLQYIEETLETLDKTCRYGFSFNCLTSYSDKHKMQNHLFYADPCFLFNSCKKKYSRNVALLHDYDLYEFTILVRKKI